MLELVTIAGIVAIWGILVKRKADKTPGPLMWQFGKFVNTRPGVKNHYPIQDEPDVVEYVDYKYWIRLRPNPGVNLPVFGYWSKHRGRRQ